jgi:hypothetical protein
VTRVAMGALVLCACALGSIVVALVLLVVFGLALWLGKVR